MVKKTRTLITSVLLFVALLVTLTLVPMPYVIWSPGKTYDFLSSADGKPAIEISGVPSYPTEDKMMLATVSATNIDRSPSLVSVIWDCFDSNKEILPADAVLAGADVALAGANNARSAVVRKTNAVVAALREANIQVDTLPMVASVSPSGPAFEILQPGDLIIKVGNVETSSMTDMINVIQAYEVGKLVTVVFLRDGQLHDPVAITARDSNTNPGVATLGITLETGYRYDPRVEVKEGWMSFFEGMMFSIAVYDLLVPGDLTNGGVVAGAGTVDSNGRIGKVYGIAQRIAAAERDGAQAFVIPSGNCADLVEKPNIRLISVEVLGDALRGIDQVFGNNVGIPTKGCE